MIYKRKITEVEAIQFTGDNVEEIQEWFDNNFGPDNFEVGLDEDDLGLVIDNLQCNWGVIISLSDYIFIEDNDFNSWSKEIFEQKFIVPEEKKKHD